VDVKEELISSLLVRKNKTKQQTA